MTVNLIRNKNNCILRDTRESERETKAACVNEAINGMMY